MNNIKHLLEEVKKNNFEEIENLFNLHIHTTCSDGQLTPVEAVEFAKHKGYKYFSITDHNNFEAYSKIDYKNTEGLITGIEFDCWYKCVFMHLLCYGIDPNAQEMKPFLAKTKAETEKDIVRIFSRRDVKKIIETVHSLGGIAVLAHPCCCPTISLNWFYKELKKIGLDGVEGFYPYKRHRAIIKFHCAKNALELGKKYNLLITAGTDEH